MVTYSWNGEAVGDLLHDGTSRGQSRRAHIRAGIAVDDHSRNNVHDGIDNLEHSQGLGKFAHVLHFRHDTEEGHVGDIGEDNVGNGQKGVRKRGRRGDVVLDIVWGLNSNGDHGNHSSDEDTDSGGNGHVEHLAGLSRKRANAAKDQADYSEDDSAGSVVGDGVEKHGEGENVTGHQEDDEQDLAKVEQLAAEWTHKKLAGITHAVHLGEAQLELAHDIARVP